MITNNDLVKIKPSDVRAALEYGERNPEIKHNNPMTGILRSTGKWILKNVFDLEKAEPLMLRLQTTQVIGRMLYVPPGFVKDGKKKIVAMYVHMPKSRLATVDSIKGITVAGWAEAWDLRTLHTPGANMICVKNDNILEPMYKIGEEQ
jgi:hypothetical protein